MLKNYERVAISQMRTAALEQTQLVCLLPFWILNQLLVALRIFLVECRLETSIVSEVHFHNKYAVCVFIWIIYLFSLLYFSSAESLRYQANNCPICRSRKYEMYRAWNWLIFSTFVDRKECRKSFDSVSAKRTLIAALRARKWSSSKGDVNS